MAASSSLNPCRFSSSPASTTYSTPHYITPNSTVPISGEFAPDTIIPISGEFAPDTIVPISNTVGTPVRTALLMAGAAVGLIPDSIREVYLSNGANPLQEPFAGDWMIHAISDGNFPVTHNSIREVYLRNGANPLHEPVAGHHFFNDDGMIHAISDGTSDFSPESDIESNLTVTADRWSNSVIELYNKHELGKAILGFAIPVSIGLLNMHTISNPLLLNLVVGLLCIGFVCIWIGLLSRAPVAIRLEQFGVATVLLAFFGFVSTFVPVYLRWAPLACWALSMVPFVLTLF